MKIRREKIINTAKGPSSRSGFDRRSEASGRGTRRYLQRSAFTIWLRSLLQLRFHKLFQTLRSILLQFRFCQLILYAVGVQQDKIVRLSHKLDLVVLLIIEQADGNSFRSDSIISPLRQIIGGRVPALATVNVRSSGVPQHQGERGILRVHSALEQRFVQHFISCAGCGGWSARMRSNPEISAP